MMGAPTPSASTALVLDMFSHGRYRIDFIALDELARTFYSSPVGACLFGRHAHCFRAQYLPLFRIFRTSFWHFLRLFLSIFD